MNRTNLNVSVLRMKDGEHDQTEIELTVPAGNNTLRTLLFVRGDSMHVRHATTPIAEMFVEALRTELATNLRDAARKGG